jgi:hypothetical protein
MDHELADIDALFRKYHAQLERLESHAKYSLTNAKLQELDNFLSRLTDLDTRMS